MELLEARAVLVHAYDGAEAELATERDRSVERSVRAPEEVAGAGAGIEAAYLLERAVRLDPEERGAAARAQRTPGHGRAVQSAARTDPNAAHGVDPLDVGDTIEDPGSGARNGGKPEPGNRRRIRRARDRRRAGANDETSAVAFPRRTPVVRSDQTTEVLAREQSRLRSDERPGRPVPSIDLNADRVDVVCDLIARRWSELFTTGRQNRLLIRVVQRQRKSDRRVSKCYDDE